MSVVCTDTQVSFCDGIRKKMRTYQETSFFKILWAVKPTKTANFFSGVMRLDSENQNATNVMKQIQIDAEPDQGPSWYKRAWASCRSQFSEPISDLPKASKMEYIPYAIVVGPYLIFYSCQTFT